MCKKLKLLCSISWLLFSQEIFAQKIKIENKENYPVYNKNLVINKSELKKHYKKGLYPVIEDSLGNALPSQTNAGKKWDKLYFQVDLKANATNHYFLKWQNIKPIYDIKTSIRFGERLNAQKPVEAITKSIFKQPKLPVLSGHQPYQTDGPTWENNKVGFRHYLDGRHSKDLFGKLSSEISPENVGLTPDHKVVDNYHVLEKWGRDILPVGNSVGIGGIALALGGQFKRIGSIATDSIYPIKKTFCKILNEGPIYSQLQIKHEALKLDGRKFQIEENPAIWASNYTYENEVKISSLKSNENLIIGLSSVAAEFTLNELKTEDWIALYTYGKQSYNQEYLIGLAVIVPTHNFVSSGKITNAEKLSNSYFAKVSSNKKREYIKYYAMGCWELSEPLFKDQKGFESYLKEFLAGLNAKVSVVIVDDK